jgi:signal recognition particle GTPase
MNIQQLYESILQELNKTQSDTPDTEMDTFLTYKREYTQPRKEVKDIVQFIESGEEKLLVVTGVAGCGKSTLIAQVYTMLQKEEKHKKPFLITHIAGLDADASTAG